MFCVVSIFNDLSCRCCFERRVLIFFDRISVMRRVWGFFRLFWCSSCVKGREVIIVNKRIDFEKIELVRLRLFAQISIAFLSGYNSSWLTWNTWSYGTKRHRIHRSQCMINPWFSLSLLFCYFLIFQYFTELTGSSSDQVVINFTHWVFI